MNELPRNQILTGDASARLAELPDSSVDCVVTSPPYYQLRDYGHPGQLGAEPAVTGWVEGLRTVGVQVARVLKPTGAFWLNLGDAFSRHHRFGVPPKSLLAAPERLMLALLADGWLLRNKVIWSKTNPLPSSVRDRLTLTWEVVYLLVRSPSYYFDLDAIREPHTSTVKPQPGLHPSPTPEFGAGALAASRTGLARAKAQGRPGHPLGRNPGDVWRTATHGFRGAHFATFPPALIRRPILATCPPLVCSDCGLPWGSAAGRPATAAGPHCGLAVAPRPGVVLDPFFGAGTTGLVAQELGRDWLGIELNPAYSRLASHRLGLADADRDPTEQAAA
jgi:site-specific DNA-methyltransferase (adenine-specific)